VVLAFAGGSRLRSLLLTTALPSPSAFCGADSTSQPLDSTAASSTRRGLIRRHTGVRTQICTPVKRYWRRTRLQVTPPC
jgi:hypothetical protein